MTNVLLVMVKIDSVVVKQTHKDYWRRETDFIVLMYSGRLLTLIVIKTSICNISKQCCCFFSSNTAHNRLRFKLFFIEKHCEYFKLQWTSGIKYQLKRCSKTNLL